MCFCRFVFPSEEMVSHRQTASLDVVLEFHFIFSNESCVAFCARRWQWLRLWSVHLSMWHILWRPILSWNDWEVVAMWLCGWQAFRLTLCALPAFFFSLHNSVKNVRCAACLSAHYTTPSPNDLVLREKRCSQRTCGSVAWSLCLFSFSQHYNTTALPSVTCECLVASLWPTEKDILQAVAATACILERLWSRYLPLSC